MHADDDTERVERLREVEPEVTSLRRPEIGGKRVGGHLQCREPRREDEQCRKDRRECVKVGADDDQQTSKGHQRQRSEDHVDRPNAARQPGGGQ